MIYLLQPDLSPADRRSLLSALTSPQPADAGQGWQVKTLDTTHTAAGTMEPACNVLVADEGLFLLDLSAEPEARLMEPNGFLVAPWTYASLSDRTLHRAGLEVCGDCAMSTKFGTVEYDGATPWADPDVRPCPTCSDGTQRGLGVIDRRCMSCTATNTSRGDFCAECGDSNGQ